MNNDWDQLRFFLAFAQNKTLTRAGRSLQVSHSTVFRKLKAMEEELGVTLFEHPSNTLKTPFNTRVHQNIKKFSEFQSNLRYVVFIWKKIVL